MKKTLFILLIFCSCKKDPPPPTVELQVRESGTNSPVAGARVLLQRCRDLGCVFGSIDEFDGITNGEGICNIPESNWNNVSVSNYDLFISKNGYWSEIFPKSNLVKILPEGWVRMQITRVGNYPEGTTLNISFYAETNPPGGTAFGGEYPSYQLEAPFDSSVLLKAFGNQSNKIEMSVVSNSTVLKHEIYKLQVPRLDTVNATIDY